MSKTTTISALTVPLLISLTLVSTINEQDFYAYHDARPGDRYVGVQPGVFYEVSETATRVCSYANVETEITDPSPRRYYNILGKTVPVLAHAYSLAIPGQGSGSAPVEMTYNYYELTLALKWHEPSAVCYDHARVASERGSLICVVDTVYYSAQSGAPLAVKFKEFTFAPSGGIDGTYPRCPLAGSPFGLASLKRMLITFSEGPLAGEERITKDQGTAPTT